jgi:hypothetical protein
VWVVVALLWLGVMGPKAPDQKFEDFRIGLTVDVAPAFCLLFGGLGFFSWLQMRKQVLLGPNGFAWVTPSRCEVFLWERIKTVRHPLKAVRDDGYSVNLTNFVDDWWQSIPFQTRWAPLMIERVRERLAQGEAVKFGPLHLTTFGVAKGGELLSWSEVDRIVRVTGRLNVPQLFKKGRLLPWASTPLGSIPNLLVFERLVVDLTKEARPWE